MHERYFRTYISILAFYQILTPSQRAVREVNTWYKLRHVNVQELLGIIKVQGGFGMVSPWRKEGNLQQYIAAYPHVKRYPLVRSTLVPSSLISC